MSDMNNSTIEGLRMQRDALLGALKTLVAELEFGNQQEPLALDREHIGICQAWDDADRTIAGIEALPKEGDGWISVSERLPGGPEELALVWDDEIGKPIVRYSLMKWPDAWTHWQSLPHPPKQE